MRKLYLMLAVSICLISCKKNNTQPVILPAVKIGNQVWQSVNLDVSTYRNGDPIPQVTDSAQWRKLTTGAWCYYNNSSSNGALYGKLYNWYAVNDPRGLAPTGWHIPTDKEWTILIDYLGGPVVAGGKLKADCICWFPPNEGATNSSMFSALPGLYRGPGGEFFYTVGLSGTWWATKNGTPWATLIFHDEIGISSGEGGLTLGRSVRCVKD